MNRYLKEKVNRIIRATKGKLINDKILYKGRFISLYEEEQLLPNGKLIKREKIIKNKMKSSVIIIAVTTDNRFILVFQNRINNIVSIEFPSGFVEDNESIIDAAKRELLEEVGYSSNNLKIVDNYLNSIGVDSSLVTIVVAYNCKKIAPQHLGECEYINYQEFDLDEVNCLIESNYINGGGGKLAFYKYMYMKTTN